MSSGIARLSRHVGGQAALFFRLFGNLCHDDWMPIHRKDVEHRRKTQGEHRLTLLGVLKSCNLTGGRLSGNCPDFPGHVRKFPDLSGFVRPDQLPRLFPKRHWPWGQEMPFFPQVRHIGVVSGAIRKAGKRKVGCGRVPRDPPISGVLWWVFSERHACQQHFLDLCELLGQPKPAEVDPDGTWYTFEKGVQTSEDKKGLGRCLDARPLCLGVQGQA